MSYSILILDQSQLVVELLITWAKQDLWNTSSVTSVLDTYSRYNEVSVDYFALMILTEYTLWVYPTTSLKRMFGTELRTLYNKNDSSSLEMNNFKDSVPSSYLENECGICSQMLRRHHVSYSLALHSDSKMRHAVVMSPTQREWRLSLKSDRKIK